MDIREEMKRWMSVFVQAANEADSKDIQKDTKLFLDAAHQLTGILAARNEALNRQCRPRKASATKPAPTKPQKPPAKRKQSDDSPDSKMGAEDRSQELSHIQQGIQQAMAKRSNAPSPEQQLRQQTYGGMNDEKRFRLAAKALTR